MRFGGLADHGSFQNWRSNGRCKWGKDAMPRYRRAHVVPMRTGRCEQLPVGMSLTDGVHFLMASGGQLCSILAWLVIWAIGKAG